jgi:LuxR family transcriptional regulator, glucitol operon activator
VDGYPERRVVVSYIASRLTIFAVLGSIEGDLRELVVAHMVGVDPAEALDNRLLATATSRFLKENEISVERPSLPELVYFMDFADTFQLLNRHASSLPESLRSSLSIVTPVLQSMVSIRNRVAHGRPLHYDDLANTLDGSEELRKQKALDWRGLCSTLQRLKQDPSFVLGLSIPEAREGPDNKHNLPLPDFDETGFLGRQKDLSALKRLVLGAYPVISIVGEGGLGKTALALKLAYDLLDEFPSRFDAVVWSSSKTTQLTATEIRKIHGAITSSLGVLHEVASQLAGNVEIINASQEIHQYLEQFKVLIILDNMENVLDENVRAFLSDLPSGSKVLITSRVGLGAFEAPYKLSPLQSGEAIQLLRATANSHGINQLAQGRNDTLGKYCHEMHYSPGFIKWFVLAVASGRSPEEILANPTLFLEFCMSNVYDNLNPESKKVLASLLSVSGVYGQTEISFLCSLEASRVQRALQQLLSSNIVNMTSMRDGTISVTKYSLSDMPRSYLLKHHKPTLEEDQQFQRNKQSLLSAIESMQLEKQRSPLSSLSIAVRSKSDLIVARFLKVAVLSMGEEHFDAAEKALDSARKLAPEYFEVFRVEAQLRAKQQNIPAARDAFDAAVELESNSLPLRYWYGRFLLSEAGDTEGAREQLTVAKSLDGNNSQVLVELARAHLYLFEFDTVAGLIGEMRLKGMKGEIGIRFSDLEVQLHYRRAEVAVEQDDCKAALRHLNRMRQVYVENPEMNAIPYYRDRLRKKAATAVRASKGLHDMDEVGEIHSIIRWMDLTSEDPEPVDVVSSALEVGLPGMIDRVFPGYGFLKLPDNSHLFFHESSLHPYAKMTDIKVGTSVLYQLGRNLKGPAATRVVWGITSQ